MIIEQTEKISSLVVSLLAGEAEKDNIVWDEFVNRHPDASVYHLSDWLNILQKESNQKILKLVCNDEDDKIVGIFPLQYTKGFPFGLGGVPGVKRLSSLPRTPIGGPLAVNEKVMQLLLEKAINIVKEDDGRFLQIKTFSSQLNVNSEYLHKFLWREIYLTEIPEHTEEIRFGDSRNHAAIKRAVKKAVKNDVIFREADKIEDLKKWYPLYVRFEIYISYK